VVRDVIGHVAGQRFKMAAAAVKTGDRTQVDGDNYNNNDYCYNYNYYYSSVHR